MTLSEIRKERQNTRLKTKRWHELGEMEKSRTSEINVKHGGEANPYHGRIYHRAQAEGYRVKAESKTLSGYLKRGKYRKMQEHHARIAQALEE